MTRPDDDRELADLIAGWPDDEKAIVARLRALRPEGEEPPWLEQQIRRAVDADVARRERRWWRRFWRPALGLGLVAAAAVTVIVARPPERRDATRATVAAPEIDAGARDAAPAPALDVAAPLALGVEGELAVEDLDDEVADVVADELEITDEPAPELGLVPDLDLAWVDDLDDEELDAVVAWLDERS